MHFSSILRLILSILVCLIGTLVNVKYLKDMKDEDRYLRRIRCNGLLTKRVMTTYTITLIVSIPIRLASVWIMWENVEILTWFQYPVCYGINIARGVRIYHAFNSLVVATMRYSFIVHRQAILRFGVEKVKTLFYYASIAIPITIEILLALTVSTNYVFGAATSACKESYQDSIRMSLGDH